MAVAAEPGSRSTGTTQGERVRLSLELSPPAYEVLNALAVATHSSQADVLRRALALMQVAVEGRRKGQKLGLADEGQELAEEITGLGL